MRRVRYSQDDLSLRELGRAAVLVRRRPQPPREVAFADGILSWTAPKDVSGVTHYNVYAPNDVTLVRRLPVGQRKLEDNLRAPAAWVSSWNEPLGLESVKIRIQADIKPINERVSVTTFGAVPDGVIVFDGAINASDATFTSASANFTAADIGKVIWIKDAGATGSSYVQSHTQTATTKRDLRTTILSINSPTSVEVAANASLSVSNVEARWGTDNTAFIQLAFDTAVSEGFRLYFPGGKYITTAALTLRSQLNIKGDGWAYKNWEENTPCVIMCCADVTVVQSLEADGDEDGWENGTISEITFRGTDRPGSKGLYSFKTIGASLFECGFTRFGDHAVHLDTNGVFGCHARGLFANDCMLVDGRTSYVGIFDFGPSDMFIADCESVGGIYPYNDAGVPLGVDLFGSGKIAAFAIRGNNSWVRDCMGALSQIGWYVGPTATPQVVTTLVNCRADQNEGEGFVVEAFNCNFIGCRSHTNGLGADATYDGVRLLTGSHQFHGCQVTQQVGVDFATIPHQHRLRHGFNVDLTTGPAFFPPSVFDMCMVGDTFSGDPTSGFTGNAYNVASGNVTPIVLTHEKHVASSQYELISTLPLDCKTKPIWFEASAGAANTRQWSIGADVVGAPNVFNIAAWNDARGTFVFPFSIFRDQTTGVLTAMSIRDVGSVSFDDATFVRMEGLAYLQSGLLFERLASSTGERRWSFRPNTDAGTPGTGQLIATLSNDDGSAENVWLRVLRNGTAVTFLQLLEGVGYLDVRGDIQLQSGKILHFGTTTAKILANSGSPEGVVTAVGGSLYLDGVGKLWIKTAGVGNTGWSIAASYPVIGAAGTSLQSDGTGLIFSKVALSDPDEVTVPGSTEEILVKSSSGAVAALSPGALVTLLLDELKSQLSHQHQVSYVKPSAFTDNANPDTPHQHGQGTEGAAATSSPPLGW